MDKAQAANELRNRGVTLEDMKNYFLTVAEPIAAMGSGIVAEPLSGFAGLAALPYGSEAAANAVEYYSDALTYQPRSQAGQAGMNAVGEVMAPIGEALDYASEGAGDYVYDKTGSPVLASMAYSAPTAALELLGLKGANKLGKSGKLGKQLEFGDIGSGGVGNKQRGIFAGVKAKGADLNRKAAAEELASRGVGRDQIWKDTGLFADVDGHWKFEIDDSGAKSRDMMKTIPDAAAQLDEFDEVMGPLGKGLTHSKARKAYPDEFKDIDYIAKPYSSGGQYKSGEIQVESDYRYGDKGIKGDKSTTLHELQHGIQESEGFARGGSPRNLSDEAAEMRHSAIRPYSEKINDIEESAEYINKYDEYKKVMRNDAAKSKVNAEFGVDALNAERLKASVKINTLLNAGGQSFDPVRAYQRLAGEAEARNVQTRMNYTPEQRQAQAPWTTLDVPESELIVKGNRQAQAMQELESRGVIMSQDAAGLAKSELDNFVSENRSLMKMGTQEEKAALITRAKELQGNLNKARQRQARATENAGIVQNLRPEGKTAKLDLSVSDDGAGTVKYTDRNTGGFIDVLVDDAAQRRGNVTGLFVPDEARGRGVANSLLRAAMGDNPSMMGQVSSKKAAANAYRAGRRPIDKPSASLGDVLSMIDDKSSVNMATQ